MTNQDFLREAIRLAATRSADGKNGPFGAVVVKDGEVVGEGWNRVVETADPTAHAEVVALRDAAAALGTHDLSGATIYSSCEPCPMCLSAIYWARIRRIVFAATGQDAADAGFDDFRILEELALEWPKRTVEGKQELAEEGRRVLEAWRENPDRIPY